MCVVLFRFVFLKFCGCSFTQPGLGVTGEGKYEFGNQTVQDYYSALPYHPYELGQIPLSLRLLVLLNVCYVLKEKSKKVCLLSQR